MASLGSRTAVQRLGTKGRKEADLSKTLLCVVITGLTCAFRQPGLVFCEVQGLAVWNYLSLAFEVLGPRARAPCEGFVSTLFGSARAQTWSDQTTQRKTCGSFSANTDDK